jgi:glycerol-3-phosphate dehydrogenase
MGTLNTYLRDAADHGATILANTKAEQVCSSDGRATGVAPRTRTPTPARRGGSP